MTEKMQPVSRGMLERTVIVAGSWREVWDGISLDLMEMRQANETFDTGKLPHRIEFIGVRESASGRRVILKARTDAAMTDMTLLILRSAGVDGISDSGNFDAIRNLIGSSQLSGDGEDISLTEKQALKLMDHVRTIPKGVDHDFLWELEVKMIPMRQALIGHALSSASMEEKLGQELFRTEPTADEKQIPAVKAAWQHIRNGVVGERLSSVACGLCLGTTITDVLNNGLGWRTLATIGTAIGIAGCSFIQNRDYINKFFGLVHALSSDANVQDLKITSMPPPKPGDNNYEIAASAWKHVHPDLIKGQRSWNSSGFFFSCMATDIANNGFSWRTPIEAVVTLGFVANAALKDRKYRSKFSQLVQTIVMQRRGIETVEIHFTPNNPLSAGFMISPTDEKPLQP